MINKEKYIDEQIKMLRVPIKRELNGLIVFIFLFVITIPVILSQNGLSILILYYFSNLDLIANILNHYELYFDNLYYPTPLSEYSFWSTSFINYISLMGIASLISIFTLNTKSIFVGLATGTTLFAKHIISPPYLYRSIRYIENTINDYKTNGKYNNFILNSFSSNTISTIFGLVLSCILVLIEYLFSLKYNTSIAFYFSFFYTKFIKLFV